MKKVIVLLLTVSLLMAGAAVAEEDFEVFEEPVFEEVYFEETWEEDTSADDIEEYFEETLPVADEDDLIEEIIEDAPATVFNSTILQGLAAEFGVDEDTILEILGMTEAGVNLMNEEALQEAREALRQALNMAAAVNDSDFTLEVSDEKYYITGYTGTAVQLRIPSVINGVPIYGIRYEAFYRSDLTSVVIESGITEIQEGAFSCSASLKNVELPDTLQEIDWEAFYGCGITSIDIPDSVRYIGSGAFGDCKSLRNVHMSDSVTDRIDIMRVFEDTPWLDDLTADASSAYLMVGHKLLEYRGSESDIVIPKDLGITSIGSSAFKMLTRIKSVVIPEGVKYIEDRAFAHCACLKSVTLPSTLVSIGNSAFYDTAITSITLPDGLESIGYFAFGDTGLKSIVIPASVTSVEEEAFSGNDNLTTADIRCSRISDYMFYGCYELETVTVGDNLEYIGDYAFERCYKLMPFDYPADCELGYDSFAECPLIEGGEECQHTNMSIAWDGRKIEEVLSDDLSTHTIVYRTFVCYECDDCGLRKKVYDDEPTTVVESHEWQSDTGRCYQCGTRNACKHENLNVYNEYDYDDGERWTEITPDYHTGEVCLNYRYFSCNDCGMWLDREERVFETLSYDREAHTFGNSGRCNVCYYECEHEDWTDTACAKCGIPIFEFRGKDGNTLLGYNGTDSDVMVPEGTLIIQGFDSSAENIETTVETVRLPNSVKTISRHAFDALRDLKDLYIPASVTFMDNNLVYVDEYDYWDEDIQEWVWVYEKADVCFHVVKGSYAEKWCIRNEARYVYMEGGIPSLDIYPESIHLAVGETFVPEIVDEGERTIKSSAKAVASVNAQTGVIKAVKAGKAIITVASGDYKKTCSVVVSAAASKVVLSAASNKAYTNGETVEVQAKVTGYTSTLEWEAADESILTVEGSVDGAVVTPVAPGSTTVTAKASNGKKGTIKITVYDMPESIQLDKETVELVKGKTDVLLAEIDGENADPEVIWSSDDEATATISPAGKITAKGVGTCTITAKTVNGLIAECEVTVTAVPTKVTLSAAKQTLGVGESFSITAVVAPVDTAKQTVTWKSSNKKVAVVEDGVVTAMAAGSAKITATTPNGKYAACTVTVKKQPTGLTLTAPKLGVGMTGSIAAKFVPSTAYSSMIEYTIVEGAEYVQIDAAGAIEALAAGEVTVSATAFGGATGSVTFTIASAPTELTLSKTAVKIAKGKSTVLKAVPNEGSIAELKFVSDNSTVATVNDSGKITGKKKGTATITVTTQNGISAECVVTVK